MITVEVNKPTKSDITEINSTWPMKSSNIIQNFYHNAFDLAE